MYFHVRLTMNYRGGGSEWYYLIRVVMCRWMGSHFHGLTIVELRYGRSYWHGVAYFRILGVR